MKCPKCNTELPESSMFCTECGAKLEIKKKSNLPIIGIVAALIVAGGCVAVYNVLNSKDAEPTFLEIVSAQDTVEPSTSITTTETVESTTSGDTDKHTLTTTGSKGVETNEAVGSPNVVPSKTQDQPKNSNTNNGSINLSYGKYSGDIKNGYPDGMGRLTYSTSRVINKHDSKQRIANAGDYVVGEFVNGFFIQGKHYSSDGTMIETLMVGAPPTNTYENK